MARDQAFEDELNARYNRVQEALIEQAETDMEVTTAMNRAAELTSVDEGKRMLAMCTKEELAARGWTRKALIIAIDAKESRAHVSFYLAATQERHNTRLRATPPSQNNGARAPIFCLPKAVNRQLGSVEEPEDEDGEKDRP